MEGWGNYAGAGVPSVLCITFEHGSVNGVNNDIAANPSDGAGGTGSNGARINPPNGTWQDGQWHTWSYMITPYPNGEATAYLDGNLYETWTLSNLDSGTEALWNLPVQIFWLAMSAAQSGATSFNPMASGDMTGYLGYLRVWSLPPTN